MSDGIGIKMEGTKELEAKFAALSQMDRFRFFAEEFKPIADKMVIAMKAQTPVSRRKSGKKFDSGRNHTRGTLRASIGRRIGGDEIPVTWISLNSVRGKDAWYQHMVVGGHEYGSTRVPPNPIVRRTWDAMEPIVSMQLKTKLENKLKLMMK